MAIAAPIPRSGDRQAPLVACSGSSFRLSDLISNPHQPRIIVAPKLFVDGAEHEHETSGHTADPVVRHDVL
jgi:hypothetical protein